MLGAWPAVYVAVAVVFGLLIGSFLNVVIYRLPIMLERQWQAECAQLSAGRPAASTVGADQADAASTGSASSAAPPPLPGRFNLAVPRSVCPSCKAPIHALQNIPVLSWLALRGRCANCRARISVRYPVVELLCAVATGLVAWRFGVTPAAGCAALVTWFLIALAGIDIDHQLLPDALTLPLLWGGLLASLAGWGAAGQGLPVDPRTALMGAALGYLSLWAVYHVFRLLTGKEGMGHGDFKLLGALGAWMGARMLLPIVLCAALVGAVVGGALILSKRQQRGVPIPFGPFLAAAGWIALMWGPRLVAAYLGLYAPAH